MIDHGASPTIGAYLTLAMVFLTFIYAACATIRESRFAIKLALGFMTGFLCMVMLVVALIIDPHTLTVISQSLP